MSDAGEPDLLVLFLMALMGIIGTGVLVAIGADNYWLLVNQPFGPRAYVSPRTVAFFGVTFVAVGLFDLIAVGMMFAGGVIVVQRLRGRD